MNLSTQPMCSFSSLFLFKATQLPVFSLKITAVHEDESDDDAWYGDCDSCENNGFHDTETLSTFGRINLGNQPFICEHPAFVFADLPHQCNTLTSNLGIEFCNCIRLNVHEDFIAIEHVANGFHWCEMDELCAIIASTQCNEVTRTLLQLHDLICSGFRSVLNVEHD